MNDVSVKLVSLDSVNITWRIPSDNNVSITSYTLIFCVSPNDTDCSHSSAINVTRQVDDLTRISENRLSYIFPELVTEKLYEIVIRAENSNGLQMAPELGNGFRFNSASADDGQVVNVSFIPTTRMIIVTWNLPALAMATANLNVSFDVLYYSDADQQNITTVPVQYNMSRPEQGVSVDLMIANSSTHVFKIQARYINPNLSSSQANLTGVRTLANGNSSTVILVL